MKKAILQRNDYLTKETLGELVLLDEGGLELFRCKTLELPWLDNQNRISCIPTGQYKAVFRTFGKYANRSFHIQQLDGSEVPGRAGILIHTGNFYTHTKGCILVGASYGHLKRRQDGKMVDDNILDILSSGPTFEALCAVVPEQEFLLEIKGTQPPLAIPTPEAEEEELYRPFEPNDKAVVSVSSYLNLRESPNKDASILSRLKDGTSVDVLELEGGWAKVFTVAVQGWVSGDYVDKDGETGVVATQGGNLNVREKAEASAELVDRLSKGTEVKILEEKEGWYKIAAGALEGYVYGEYLSK
ncbi:DUF5675 family protein [Algivirga pacifica]|uniref:SH3b domain-containing protein n=1 Tax=Algivirga pacifica TaxID=1162670 RepID=A0ABP9D0H4_9BACT